ncbi:MAG: division/cell wall cluster transcriptional repressor MraZ [Acidimicrobiia bacterium]
MAETVTSTERRSGAEALVGPDGAPASAAHPASQFRGRAEYAIDDKGRLTLPVQMRKALLGGGSLVVMDGRAVIWDEPTYQRAVDQLNERVATGDLTSGQVRAFLSNTHQVNPDTQGRIVIPHAVRIEAGLERDVLVLGAGPRIEIVPVGDASLEAVLSVDDAVVDALDRALF